ncbi:rhomboid family intramembrane serine protease [Cytobacillus praedii]|uniref:rhomboid family intramembrane serine protease n=1 Tax=Cytobacillus praedii TaxID=1742358 RepID=UPI003AF98BE8
MFKVREDFSTFIRVYPITTAVLFICAVLTSIALIGGHDAETRLILGAYEKQKVNEGQIWRLLTYSLGHMSFLHFLINIPFLLLLSRPLENLLGSKFFLIIYIFLSIFTGLIIHFFSNYPVPLAGSSGVGYGLMGLYIFLLFKKSHLFTLVDKRFILFFLLFGFAGTILLPNISMTGHVGGFAGGLLISPLLFKLKATMKSENQFNI